MALIDTPPPIQLLEALKTDLESIDFADRAGVVSSQALKVRHERSRRSKSDESPCAAVRWDDDADQDIDASYKNADERPLLLDVTIIFDVDLVDEDAVVNPDPTGWLVLERCAAAAIERFREEDSAIAQLSSWVIDRRGKPSEDSKPDKGRLELPISVVYRVRTDNPNVLLAQGAN